jgi:hypothetical protein
MMIGEESTSPSGSRLRDTEFGDLCGLDHITNRSDWPLKNNGRPASCSYDDMLRLNALIRQHAARSEKLPSIQASQEFVDPMLVW